MIVSFLHTIYLMLHFRLIMCTYFIVYECESCQRIQELRHP